MHNTGEMGDVSDLQERFAMLASADPAYSMEDEKIMRFITACKGDKEKAFMLLMKCVKWRKEFGVEDINADSCRTEVDSKKAYVHAHDLGSHPVIYVHARRHDKDKRDVEELSRFIVLTLETAVLQCTLPQKSVVLVFDLSGFTLQCMDYEAIKRLIAILSKYYPETLADALVVDAPTIFSGCWALISPWLDPVTAKKVKFIQRQQLPEFIATENIAPDCLPADTI